MTTTRYALVAGVTDAERIAPYLPGCYRIAAETPDGVIIAGEDNAGWTLDDYVIPRLGSGMIFAREITAAEASKAVPVVLRRDVPVGSGEGWLVRYRGHHCVISQGHDGAVQAFHSDERGKVTDWDELAGGPVRDHEGVLAELAGRPTDDDGKIMSRRAELDAKQEAENTARIKSAAAEIADSITQAARGSGSDPIAWVTGNAYMPPLRSFPAAERVYQDDEDGEDFDELTHQVEQRLEQAGVALECPDYDNALYAVDLRRFESVEDPGDHETLQQDWRAKPVHADYPHEPGRLHDCPACDDHCHCTPGYTECVFEGEHNGLADAPPGTPCENCGCAS